MLTVTDVARCFRNCHFKVETAWEESYFGSGAAQTLQMHMGSWGRTSLARSGALTTARMTTQTCVERRARRSGLQGNGSMKSGRWYANCWYVVVVRKSRRKPSLRATWSSWEGKLVMFLRNSQHSWSSGMFSESSSIGTLGCVFGHTSAHMVSSVSKSTTSKPNSVVCRIGYLSCTDERGEITNNHRITWMFTWL